MDVLYQAIFQCVQNAVVSNTTLWYFHASCPMTVQVDVSQVGLGAALPQDNKPVAFPSKALTEVESCYDNIEHEMLAVVFGAEQFRAHVYGRLYTIDCDHKPLVSVTQKSLADTPAQLQYMLVCLQENEYILCYCSGKEMVLPDTLSCFKSKPGPEIALDITIHHACLSLSKRKPSNWLLRQILRCVPSLISSLAGPNDMKEVPCPLWPPWKHHESLTVEDGFVFHEEALIIPPLEGEKDLGTPHQSLPTCMHSLYLQYTGPTSSS